MRWLKHLTETRQDEKIAKLIARYGLEAYGLWWAVLEVIGRQITRDHPNRCSLSYPVSKWAAELSLRGSLVRRKLSTLAVTGVVTLSWDGRELTVTIPNILKYKDEYQKKSGHTPESVGRKQENEIEQEQVPSSLHGSGSKSKPRAPKNGAVNSREFSDVAIQLFKEKFGQAPTWSTPDFVQLAGLLKRSHPTVAEFVRRYSIMLASEDPLQAKQNGSLRFFCSNFDLFIRPPFKKKTAGERQQEIFDEMERRDQERQSHN